MQITSIPPKWVDWDTTREITSSVGRMIDLDWQTLFNSFFSVVRVKLLCKNPSKIPRSRMFAFGKDLHVVYFKVEGYEQSDSEDGDGDLNEGFEATEHDDDLPGDSHKGFDEEKEDDGQDQGGEQQKQSRGSDNGTSGNKCTKRTLIFEESLDDVLMEGLNYQDASLLDAMELEKDPYEDFEEVENSVLTETDDFELTTLPDEWIYDPQSEKQTMAGKMESDPLSFSTATGETNKGGVTSSTLQDAERREREGGPESPFEAKQAPGAGGKKKDTAKAKQQWGPIIPVRRSNRFTDNGKAVIENAQDF